VCSHCRHFDQELLDNIQERNSETNCNFHSLMVAYHEYLMVTQLSRLHILRSRSAPFGSSMGLNKTKTKHKPYRILRPRKPNGSKKSWAIAQIMLVQPSRIPRLSAHALHSTTAVDKWRAALNSVAASSEKIKTWCLCRGSNLWVRTQRRRL
jgi:hypothetical protein